MADLVMGAMGSLIPKLLKLLKEEYSLQTGVKKRINSLTQELEVAQAALRKVAQVPWDQLDEQVQIWARQVREASYDMEDVLDTFLVRVQDPDASKQESFLKKITSLWKKSKARRKISVDVEGIMGHLQAVTEQCRRYKVNDIAVAVRPGTTSTVDPRLHAMYNKVKDLVGMDKPSRELMSMLQSNTKIKIVSIVGVGGLGKTTLAKAVYDQLKRDFDCKAFVPVGRNPDLKKVLKDILMDLDRTRYLTVSSAVLDERQLIDDLRNFFVENNKRYFIVIDDIWDIQSWETIKLAIDDDNNCGGRIIITTRNMEVATKADEVYKLQPLPYDSSAELFFTRISGHEGSFADNQQDEITDKFIRKCGGIPLAIITMASLLAGKQRIEWYELYRTIDFGCKGNKEAENTMRILSFSFYDLPSHLRTCLLYVGAYPEDSIIPKDSLVWKWIAEGFVQAKEGIRPFEIGESYFNDLINRCMIQEVELDDDDDDRIINGCCIHDMMLDFIRSMSREESFLTVLDNNDQVTLLQTKVRRLAYHNWTMEGNEANNFDLLKVRSFVAINIHCFTMSRMWVLLQSFKLLRVLAMENCMVIGHMFDDHLGHLLHLRFLSLRGTWISEISEEIGALRFLQTLDLWGSSISKLPPSSSLPKQLMCLRITFDDGNDPDEQVLSVERLTSLEELSIDVERTCKTRKWLVKSLGSLRELRLLYARIYSDEDTEKDLLESLRHLQKLQHLTIKGYNNVRSRFTRWEATEFVLSHHLRHLAIHHFSLWKLPSWISPSSHPILSQLDLILESVDEQDLKTLGRLPELRFLGLDLGCSGTISNVTGSDAGYFPKLRCCKLRNTMGLFLASKEDKIVSFHIWHGEGSIDMPSVPEGEKNSSICSKGVAALPTAFMPSLQVLHFKICKKAILDRRYWGNLGLEYLSSLREIKVDISDLYSFREKKAKRLVRGAAKVHPNRPTVGFTNGRYGTTRG